MFNRIITPLLGLTLLSAALHSPAAAQVPVNSRLMISGNCSGCDLSGRDMSQLTLTGADFTNSVFNHADLSGGEFDGSNLSGAHFRRAYLIRTKGNTVNLSRAVLSDAMMNEAHLTASNLSETDLRRADMSGGVFTGSDFTAARLTNASATQADFTQAKFHSAQLDHANFENAIFTSAEFKDAKFGHAYLDGASFEDADLSGADLSETRGLTQNQLDQACGSHSTKLPTGNKTLRICPKNMLIAASTPDIAVSDRTRRRAIIDGVDYGPKLDQLERTRKDLRETLATIDRAIEALPPRGSAAARAELQFSRRQIVKMMDRL